MTWAGEHLTGVVLPWWEQHGADDTDGGVWSCFRNDGTRISTDKYTWSQGRWAWLCAELARSGERGELQLDPAAWRARAVATARFLSWNAVRVDYRTHFRTDTLGTPSTDPAEDPEGSVFADLFAVLGLAAASGLAPDEPFADLAEAVLLNVDILVARGGAPTAPYPVAPGFVDLASSMSLLHAGSETVRLTGRAAARPVVRAAADRLVGRHLRSDSWWEYAPVDPRDGDTLLARHRTPGHLLECLWMLLHAVDTDPSLERAELAPEPLARLALHALEIGWDDQEGGILRYVDAGGGRPRGRLLTEDPYQDLVARTWDTKLWWVHVEALYATALLAARTPRLTKQLTGWHERIRDWTLATFPAPGAEWIQIRSRTGRPLDEVVALPVKDPFHIARALLLLHRLQTGTVTPLAHEERTIT